MAFDYSSGELGQIDRDINGLIQQVVSAPLDGQARQQVLDKLAELQMLRVKRSEPKIFQDLDQRLRA
ncbi:MAG: hypothetical protein EOO15_17715 [Chitinophagaceae bacterium]|nr:MAG: hypothetical protein EOO15_17715 [Chitinophagaceae bacterium]